MAQRVALALAAMATRFELILETGPHGESFDEPRLRGAGELALEEVAEVERRLSRFRRDSLVSALLDETRADRGVVATRDEIALFELCRRGCELTDGAFDPAFDSEFAAKTIDRAIDAVERRPSPFSSWRVDRRARRVVAPHDASRLDFGAIGKGHALDRAVRVLRESGVTSALLHGGTSSVTAIGTRGDGAPWKVAIRDPFEPTRTHRPSLAVVELRDASLSVSALHAQPGHVVDPRDGAPVERTKLAAVVARHGAVAEIASTALLVLVERRLRAAAPLESRDLDELPLPRHSFALVVFERDDVRHVLRSSSASPRAALSTVSSAMEFVA